MRNQQVIGHIIYSRVVIARARIEYGINAKRTALARIHIVLAHELPPCREFHDLAWMEHVRVDGIAIGSQQVAIRRPSQRENARCSPLFRD